MTDSEFIVNTNLIDESDGCIANPYAIDNTVLAGTSRDQPSTTTRGKHGQRKEYSWHCSFRNLDIAESHIKGNNCCQNCFHCIFCNTAWTHHQTTETNQGVKFFYRCKDCNCPARLQLFSDGIHVTLYAADENNHDGAPVSSKVQSLGFQKKQN